MVSAEWDRSPSVDRFLSQCLAAAAALCSGRRRWGGCATPLPPPLSENEERAGKFDGNYLAVSPYKAEAGDGWDGELLLSLNSEGQAAQTHSSQGALGLTWGVVVVVGGGSGTTAEDMQLHVRSLFHFWALSRFGK